MKQLAGACSVSLALTAVAWAQTPAGGEFQVNTYTTGSQGSARAAMGSDGDFVVVWGSSYRQGNGVAVFGQRFDGAGVPRGSEFRVNGNTTPTQSRPAVAVGGRGDFVAVWQSLDPPSYANIEGRRFDASGDPTGNDFQVNAFTEATSITPRVARAPDGRFVVVWRNDAVDGNGPGIAGRRFDASGTPVGGDFVVNAYVIGAQWSPDVAMQATGDFVGVWEDPFGNRDGSGSALFGQRYSAAGNRLASEFLVNSFTLGWQQYPSVSVSPAGGFVVAWMSTAGDGSGYGVFARRFDAIGNPQGSDFAINTYTTGEQVAPLGLAHDARGNFIVTWSSVGQDGSSQGIFGQRFSASGARRGAEFRVNTYTTGSQGGSSVASDSVGNFVVTWSSAPQDESDGGVFAQRFGGLAAAALAANSSGNQVLEPGEMVDVRPSWRNVNGAAQTFSATLGNITGPAGATYTITDPTGDYVTVANGVTGQCTDCYAVSVSNPVTRPAQHWDASAVESILPDTQGQQKQWLLHVGGSFTDVPASSPFYRFIETLLHKGVTGGCGGTNYCPSATTTRDQMSVFVLVAKEGAGYTPPACGTPVFADVPASNPFCKYIEELARRGVVSGCGGNNYCPTNPVTREQMAIFVLRTLDPALNPPACVAPNIFADVPETSPFCRWIEELTNRGVVSGCGSGNYCPTAAVTREQMGVFISVTFGLTLYGP